MPPVSKESIEQIYEDIRYINQNTLPALQSRLTKIETKLAATNTLWLFNILLLGALIKKTFGL